MKIQGKIADTLKAKLSPHLFIRLFFELNLDLGICSYLQISLFSNVTSWVDIFSSCLAVFSAILCLFVPFYSAIILYRLKSQDLLHHEKIKHQYGALYEQQLVKNPTLYHLLYNVFFMYRRITTLICIFYMYQIPSFQIGCMMWMTTFWMGYSLSVKPFEDPVLNSLELVNEVFYNLILFLCFTFTSLLPDFAVRD